MPLSVKTELNDISLRYGLWNHEGSAVSIYDVINVMQGCFDVNVLTFVSSYLWCVLGNTTQTKCAFPHFECVSDSTRIIICMNQHFFTNYRPLVMYTICFQG